MITDLPLYTPAHPALDWMLVNSHYRAGLFRTDKPDEVVLSNGLISRTFRLRPDAATVGLANLMTDSEMLRAVKPEGTLTLDGVDTPVGGLVGQPDLAYFTTAWLDRMRPDAKAFHFVKYEVGPTQPRFGWKQVRHAGNTQWPPAGVQLTLWFKHDSMPLRVAVKYELYDNVPLYSKWLTVYNDGSKAVRISKFKSEQLGLTEAESMVDRNPSWQLPNVTAISDYAFGGMATNNSNRTAHWVADKHYTTQVNYELESPCDLEMSPSIGPDIDVDPGKTFDTFRSFILVHDSSERERRSLQVRRVYRVISPWVTENPIMLHLTSSDPAVVHRAIDQAAECGFELVVISFWSGLDMEDHSPANIEKFTEFRKYANAKGVELGGYSLLASRHIDAANDVVNPKPAFGSSPCLGSTWGIAYFQTIRDFFAKTGFNLLEHDGSYPGDTCASTVHPGHHGLDDSQWTQYATISNFYKECRANGTFLNVPDNYFLVGSNKTGMGYRESNWSLPRAQQHIHARQNLFDGTWDKTPSMGWMMTPLVEYQGGGPEATIEPLHEHLHDYEMILANNFGYGAQSCYRGPRIYDTPETKAAVIKWVTWFKKHREILESDVIHVRRADGRQVDAVVHVNPFGKEKAMALYYNPSTVEQKVTLHIPLYFAGLQRSARVEIGSSDGHSRTSRTQLTAHTFSDEVTIPAQGCTWVIFS